MSPPTPRQELAAAAYAHACAVLGQSAAATEAAVLAVRLGGRSLGSVLGHARRAALAADDTGTVVDAGAPAPADLDQLAEQLAFLRPAEERAVVDLDSRYALDPASLAQSLGMSPAAAASRAADVAAEWQRTVDPVLLAHLGPGACPELAALLGPATGPLDEAEEPPPTTLAALLTAGQRAAAHVGECETCRDRLRAMVSVRTLLAQRPIGEPPAIVLEAAAVARLRATAVPQPLERVRFAARRRLPVLAAITAVAVGAVVGGRVLTGDEDDSTSRLDAMTQVPAASTNALAVRPEVVDGATRSVVRLRNLRDAGTSWTATPNKPWVVVSPSSGELGADDTSAVSITVGPDAPEGEVTASVTFTSSDGSTAVTKVDTTIAHRPDVAAERSECRVTATVEDDSELVSVTLHQERAEPAAMRRDGADGGPWVATLAAHGGTWWVTATDAFGNEGRTEEQALTDGC